MKASSILYVIGLLLIVASITFIVKEPESGRAALIAGGLAVFGFPMNIAGFLMKKS